MNNLIQMDIALAWNEIEEARCSLNQCDDLTPEIIDAIDDRLDEAMALIGDYFSQAILDKVTNGEGH
tara:strand:+ start:550 stop:750 length:201 start_codon:yes stop_codon:yes gene_type:complete